MSPRAFNSTACAHYRFDPPSIPGLKHPALVPPVVVDHSLEKSRFDFGEDTLVCQDLCCLILSPPDTAGLLLLCFTGVCLPNELLVFLMIEKTTTACVPPTTLPAMPRVDRGDGAKGLAPDNTREDVQSDACRVFFIFAF